METSTRAEGSRHKLAIKALLASDPFLQTKGWKEATRRLVANHLLGDCSSLEGAKEVAADTVNFCTYLPDAWKIESDTLVWIEVDDSHPTPPWKLEALEWLYDALPLTVHFRLEIFNIKQSTHSIKMDEEVFAYCFQDWRKQQ